MKLETGTEGPEVEGYQIEMKSKAARTKPKKLIRRTYKKNGKKLLFCRSLIGRLLVLFSKRTEAVDIGIG